MSMKDLINVWVVKTGYSGVQAKECFRNNIISFDLKMHILDEFEEDLSKFYEPICLEDRYRILDEKYDYYTNNIMIELEHNLDSYNYFSNSDLRKEKIANLKEMLEGMNNDLTFFHTTMNKFDEFEIMEGIKKEIQQKLYSISEKKLEMWAFDVARFTASILKGDIIVMPIPDKTTFAIARVISDYKYNQNAEFTKHYHDVYWLNIVNQFSELRKELKNSSSVFKLTGDTREVILKMLVAKRKSSKVSFWQEG